MSSGRSAKEIVVDAGPLIALARIDKLVLPARLFGRVMVTRAVVSECVVNPAQAEVQPIRSAIEARCMDVVDVGQEHPVGLWNLDGGECSVIALARARRAAALMDDRAARRAARLLGITVIGTCGLLLLAKRGNLIPAVSPLLHRLVESGYYLDSALIDRVGRVAGEI